MNLAPLTDLLRSCLKRRTKQNPETKTSQAAEMSPPLQKAASASISKYQYPLIQKSTSCTSRTIQNQSHFAGSQTALQEPVMDIAVAKSNSCTAKARPTPTAPSLRQFKLSSVFTT